MKRPPEYSSEVFLYENARFRLVNAVKKLYLVPIGLLDIDAGELI